MNPINPNDPRTAVDARNLNDPRSRLDPNHQANPRNAKFQNNPHDQKAHTLESIHARVDADIDADLKEGDNATAWLLWEKYSILAIRVAAANARGDAATAQKLLEGWDS